MEFLLSLGGHIHWGSFKRSGEQEAAGNPPEVFLACVSGELNTIHAQNVQEASTVSQSRKGQKEHRTGLLGQSPRHPGCHASSAELSVRSLQSNRASVHSCFCFSFLVVQLLPLNTDQVSQGTQQAFNRPA